MFGALSDLFAPRPYYNSVPANQCRGGRQGRRDKELPTFQFKKSVRRRGQFRLQHDEIIQIRAQVPGRRQRYGSERTRLHNQRRAHLHAVQKQVQRDSILFSYPGRSAPQVCNPQPGRRCPYSPDSHHRRQIPIVKPYPVYVSPPARTPQRPGYVKYVRSHHVRYDLYERHEVEFCAH